MKNNILEKKHSIRKEQFELRKKLYSSANYFFNEPLFTELFNKKNLQNYNIVSSFISINSEIDTTELNDYILRMKKILCLPVIFKKNNHLLFRKFSSKNEMEEGLMKIKEPKKENKILIPNILFIPCLAFDNRGFRLGYGGGYYDRTLARFRNNNNRFVSIGYAFEGQKIPVVPTDKFDMKLDYVITEKMLYTFI